MCQLLVLHTCFIVSPLYLSIRDRYDLHYILPWQMNSCFTNLSSWDRFFPDSSDFPDISYILPWQMNNCFTNLRQIFPDFPDFPDIYYITPWQMNSCFTKQISKATNNLSGQNVMYTWEIWKVVEKKIFLTVHILSFNILSYPRVQIHIHFLSYGIQILHGSSYGLSEQLCTN